MLDCEDLSGYVLSCPTVRFGYDDEMFTIGCLADKIEQSASCNSIFGLGNAMTTYPANTIGSTINDDQIEMNSFDSLT